MKSPKKENPESSRERSQAPEKKTFKSEDLFQGSREVLILHGDFLYRLQITKAGKLILIK